MLQINEIVSSYIDKDLCLQMDYRILSLLMNNSFLSLILIHTVCFQSSLWRKMYMHDGFPTLAIVSLMFLL